MATAVLAAIARSTASVIASEAKQSRLDGLAPADWIAAPADAGSQ